MSSKLPTPITLAYKTLPNGPLQVDIYLPTFHSPTPSPILLFLHGGAWISGSRKDIPFSTFHAFLARNFTIVSISYRLLPESSFLFQLDDIKDAETWLRSSLPQILSQNFQRVIDGEKIVVLGVSAGAHLALLTPKLWEGSPSCIISMYGPTDLLSLAPVRKGTFKNFKMPEITPMMLNAAIIDPPPTETLPLGSPAAGGGLEPRMLLSLGVIGGGVVGEFLVRGLVDGVLPEKGSVDDDALKDISPYYLADDIHYPPAFQAMGTEDEVFDISQVRSFDSKLRERGVESKVIVVAGKGHSFDMNVEVGGEIYSSVILRAVEFAQSCLARQ